MKYADGPTTEVSTRIDANADTVWGLISDIGLPARFSSELQATEWLDQAAEPRPGAQFKGRNSHELVGTWETNCVITACEPPRRFEWAVGEPDHPSATWRFTVDEVDGDDSVELTQWVRLGPAPSGLTSAIESMPDKEERIIARRLDEHRENMEATVRGIKELAEAIDGG